MSSVASSGTQSASINTKHSLYATTTAGTYSLLVDTNNMVLGDTLELYIDVAFASGGTRRQTYNIPYSHAQGDPGKISVPVIAPYGAEFHLKQTAGTGRSFPWCVVLL